MTDNQVPRCPEWLGPIGQQEWTRVTEKLDAAGVMGSVDEVALETYCRAYETWRRAEEWIDKNGFVIAAKNDNGEIKSVTTVPHVGISKTALNQVRQFLSNYGIS